MSIASDSHSSNKAVVDDLIVNIPPRSVLPFLTCPICQGIFREAHTITTCNHTFCKACIVNFMYNMKGNCPVCNEYLGRNPFDVLRTDQPLQNLVDTIFREEIKEYNEQELEEGEEIFNR